MGKILLSWTSLWRFDINQEFVIKAGIESWNITHFIINIMELVTYSWIYGLAQQQYTNFLVITGFTKKAGKNDFDMLYKFYWPNSRPLQTFCISFFNIRVGSEKLLTEALHAICVFYLAKTHSYFPIKMVRNHMCSNRHILHIIKDKAKYSNVTLFLRN